MKDLQLTVLEHLDGCYTQFGLMLYFFTHFLNIPNISRSTTVGVIVPNEILLLFK
jgi:uncharacterized membrane protein (DUF485 family)